MCVSNNIDGIKSADVRKLGSISLPAMLYRKNDQLKGGFLEYSSKLDNKNVNLFFFFSPHRKSSSVGSTLASQPFFYDAKDNVEI